MKLIFLSQANLRDKKFIHDLVHSFKCNEPTLLLHDHFGSHIEDTRFVTKRLSALLSEAYVVNNAFSGDQRTILKKQNDGTITFRADFVRDLMGNLELFIMNPLAENGIGSVEADPVEVLNVIRKEFGVDEVVVFPENSMSPLGKEKKAVSSEEDYQKLASVFEEEKPVLQVALRLAPAVIASAANFLM
ncbi:MAG: hypothetical protein H6581_06715 [Bacteroidia bacterium]|nr:hypothetical protein [Bacteroidia bacterium]